MEALKPTKGTDEALNVKSLAGVSIEVIGWMTAVLFAVIGGGWTLYLRHRQPRKIAYFDVYKLIATVETHYYVPMQKAMDGTLEPTTQKQIENYQSMRKQLAGLRPLLAPRDYEDAEQVITNAIQLQGLIADGGVMSDDGDRMGKLVGLIREASESRARFNKRAERIIKRL